MAEINHLIIHGGPIVTIDKSTIENGAVVVRDGRITEVVNDLAAIADRPGERYDLAGRTLVPGFIDAHNHLSVAALHPVFGDATDVRTEADLVALVQTHAAEQPEAEYLRLHSWDDTKCDFALDRHLLDRIDNLADHPIVVAHSSLHQCVANSAALDRIGVAMRTPDPPGGEISRDTQGAPTGLLQETAWSEAHRRSLIAYADPDRWEMLIAQRARALIRTGITSVHDAACAPDAEARYMAMADSGDLPISVVAMPHSAALLRNDLLERLDGPVTGDGDAKVRVGAVKLFADGGIAIALDVTMNGNPIRHGHLMDDLQACARRAVDRGYRIAVHAVGNRGVDHALDTFADLARAHPGRDHRFRLEHAGVTGPDQWRRTADLDAIGVVQPGFVEHFGISSSGVTFDDHHWLAFAGLAAAGVRLAGSSDDPCAPVAPLWCIDKGVFRTTSTGLTLEANQSVAFESWLRAYTLDAAYAGGQEDERGSITGGKVADFVEIANLDECTTRSVAATWIGGQRVFVA